MSTLHAWLEFTDVQTGSPRRADLDSNSLTLGRTNGEVRIDDPAVSEIHAIISRERESFIVRDLGSRGGTFINGRQVVEAELSHLDELRVGSTKIVFNAAYLSPEVAAARKRSVTTPTDINAPGHRANTPAHRLVNPFSMFVHPLRFWPQALETSILGLRRTWLVHLLGAAVLAFGARASGGGVPLHLGFLMAAGTAAFILIAMTCSVFFAFDSLPDAPHRLSQSLRFVFCLAPFLLLVQIVFLIWASRAHPRPSHYFLADLIPTMVFWIFVGVQSHFAFAASFSRGLAFAVTASVPWNLFMTGLMSFMV